MEGSEKEVIWGKLLYVDWTWASQCCNSYPADKLSIISIPPVFSCYQVWQTSEPIKRWLKYIYKQPSVASKIKSEYNLLPL